MPKLTKKLRAEYNTLYVNSKIRKKWYDLTMRRARMLFESKYRYVDISEKTGVPWKVIATIHNMEGRGLFDRQLFNGQKWNRRTTLVPKKRGPWSSWEDAALIAMKELYQQAKKNIPDLEDNGVFDLAECLWCFENHNGWGYRKRGYCMSGSNPPGFGTPYIWSFTDQYTKGRYVSDGKFSSSAVSQQVGSAAMLRALDELDVEEFPVTPNPIMTDPKPEPINAPIPVEDDEPEKEYRKAYSWHTKIIIWLKGLFR